MVLAARKQLRMSSAPTTAPCRGGINHFGVFIGDSSLNIEYKGMTSLKLPGIQACFQTPSSKPAPR